MPYSIGLFAREPIVFDRERVLDAMRARLGSVDMATPNEEGGTLMFLLQDHGAQFQEGALPAQLVLLPADRRPGPDEYADALQQSWGFREAREVVESCGHFCLFADMMSATLPQTERRQILAAGLSAVLETTAIDAVHFVETQQFLQPEKLIDDLGSPQQRANPTTGFYNVRFFNIANSPGDMVMDTLGLAAFGLTDLQVLYRGLDPNDVARVMHTTAVYLMERGDVIDNGHTIQGRAAEERWACRREASLLEPGRAVLDIDPGTPYAASRRAA